MLADNPRPCAKVRDRSSSPARLSSARWRGSPCFRDTRFPSRASPIASSFPTALRSSSSIPKAVSSIIDDRRGAAGRRDRRHRQGPQQRQRRHCVRRRPTGRHGPRERGMMRRLIVALLICLAAAPAAAVRIKDIRCCAARATANWSDMASWSASKAPATPCATRRSPSSPSKRCSSAWASTCTAPRCATATSRRSSSPRTLPQEWSRARGSTSPSPRSATRRR